MTTSGAPAPKKRSYVSYAVAAAILLVVVGLRLSFGLWRVPQKGMFPSIDGEKYLVGERRPDTSSIRRGDLLVFSETRSDGRYEFVWRVVGLPGDTISINDDVLSINGTAVPQRAMPDDQGFRIFEESSGGATWRIALPSTAGEASTFPATTVPDGAFFLLGDNRHNAYDSRKTGPVAAGDVVAKIVTTFEL